MMTAATGQLCARARFWASLRIDGELSELEGALLDAHLGRCADCQAYEAGIAGATAALRNAPLVPVAPVVVEAPARPGRIVAGLLAATLVVLAAVVGGLVRENASPGAASTVGLRNVAVVATVETPDQLRRLRRTTLLNQRVLPRDISREPY
jgi:predicted anti-sigma-YlaC factor YlaD